MTDVRTMYTGPRGFRGSTITVRGPEGTRTYPYEHSAYDAHTSAAVRYAGEVLGIDATATRVRYTRSRRGFVCALTLTAEALAARARSIAAHPAGSGLSGAHTARTGVTL